MLNFQGSKLIEGLVTCRAGLEKVVAAELKDLEISVTRLGKRSVFFETDLAGFYRCNMGLHTGIQVLRPLRTFNARNYDMLYYQSRKTNWHKMFPVEKTVRIDVNGGSSNLRNTEYVVHRIKDGIVDTFRKLTDGQRPSIDKQDPDVHVVGHLDGDRVTLCLGMSGRPLFKRGYREEHGLAPIKEDLAAGILKLSGWNPRTPLLDPMCGSGTFLFEAWMLATQTAPNLNRSFAFESLYDYEETVHAEQKQWLQARIKPLPIHCSLIGIEKDLESFQLAQKIASDSFADAAIKFYNMSFQDSPEPTAEHTVVTNPPYGIRLSSREEADDLHRQLLQTYVPKGWPIHIFTANLEVIPRLPGKPKQALTLFNGALEARLLSYL